jgi:hypothetical protein
VKHHNPQSQRMATSALIFVSEYLPTAYRPDCEPLDGFRGRRGSGEKLVNTITASYKERSAF